MKMKILSFLLLLSFPSCISSSTPTWVGNHNRLVDGRAYYNPFQQPTFGITTTTSNTLTLLRGGGIRAVVPAAAEPAAPAALCGCDLELASNILLQAFGAINAWHGFMLAIVPSIGSNLMLGESSSDMDVYTAYAQEALGVFALEYGLTGYLAAATTGGLVVSPEKAIAYGTLPDLIFLTKNLLNGNFAEFGVEKLVGSLAVIAAASTAAIFADQLHRGPVLEILAILPAIQGSMKYFDPVGSGKKMLGTDLSDKPMAKALYRHSGALKIVSAVLRGCIAFGVKPLKALGYSSLVNAVLLADSIFHWKTAKDIGVKNEKQAQYHQIGSLVLSLVMGTVFMLQGDE